MRRSSLTLLEHWAVHESPVLPFLTPAIFAPWLNSSQYLSTTPLERPKPLQKFYGPTSGKRGRVRTNTDVTHGNYGVQVPQKTRLRVNAPHIKSSAASIGRRSFHSCPLSSSGDSTNPSIPAEKGDIESHGSALVEKRSSAGHETLGIARKVVDDQDLKLAGVEKEHAEAKHGEYPAEDDKAASIRAREHASMANGYEKRSHPQEFSKQKVMDFKFAEGFSKPLELVYHSNDYGFAQDPSLAPMQSEHEKRYDQDQHLVLDENINMSDQTYSLDDETAPVQNQNEEDSSERQLLRQRLLDLRNKASSTQASQQLSHIPFEQANEPPDLSAPETDVSQEERRTWASGIARLAVHLDRQSRGFETQKHHVDNEKQNWIDGLPLPGSTLEAVENAWQTLEPKLRTLYWLTITLHYLEHAPAHAVTFLNATIMDPLPPPYQFAGAADIIAQIMYHRADNFFEAHHLAYFATVEKALKCYETPPSFSQHSLYMLLRLFPQRAGSTLEMLQWNRVRLHHRTLLNFTRVLAESHQYENALHTLQQAIARGASPSSITLLKVCSILLRTSQGKEGNYQESSKVVAALFAMGIRFNIAMYNILLLNASEAGDPGTAWRIYEMIRENGISPDEYTYTTMMKMCRTTNAKEQFRFLYYELNPENRALHPYLVTEILACRYHFNLRSNFDHLSRFYEIHCDLQPLKNLGIVAQTHETRHYHLPLGLQGPRPQPCAGTLGMMILAYVRQEQRLEGVKYIYRRFLRLIKEEDPCIMPLVATTHTYNVFLKAYSRKRGTLSRWRHIIRDMVAPLPPDLINRETGLPLKRAPPDVQTWNIIVNGLARARLDEDAENLVQLMHKNNMKPDIVTWNSLLGGLASSQKIYKTAHLLHKMSNEGIRPDKHTRKALSKVRNQPRLLRRVSNLEKGRVKRENHKLPKRPLSQVLANSHSPSSGPADVVEQQPGTSDKRLVQEPPRLRKRGLVRHIDVKPRRHQGIRRRKAARPAEAVAGKMKSTSAGRSSAVQGLPVAEELVKSNGNQ